MGPEGAVNIVFRRELDEAGDPARAGREDARSIARSSPTRTSRRSAGTSTRSSSRARRGGGSSRRSRCSGPSATRTRRGSTETFRCERRRDEIARMPRTGDPSAGRPRAAAGGRETLDEARRALGGRGLPARSPVARRPGPFATSGGAPSRLYRRPTSPASTTWRDLGFPGEYPFTRGVQPTMYRGRLWTMRQYAGFGSATETNRRFRYLLAQGQTGLPWPSTCRPRWATTPTRRWRGARSARSAWRSRASRTWASCSTASRSTGSRPR